MIAEHAIEAAADRRMWFAGDTLVTFANGRVRWSEPPAGRSGIVGEGVLEADARGSTVVMCRQSVGTGTVIEAVRLPDLAVTYSFKSGLSICRGSLALDPTGRYLATFDSGGTVEDLQERHRTANFGVAGRLEALLATPDGLRVLARQNDTVTESRIEPGTLPNAPNTVRSGAISHDGTQLATIHIAARSQTQLSLWRGDDQRLVASVMLSREPSGLWFDRSGDHVLISFGDGADIEIRHARQLTLTATVVPGGPATVRFDDQGRLLTGTKGEIATWEIGSGAKLGTVSVPGRAFTSDVLPFDVLGNGRVVVVSPDGHGLDEWDLRSGQRGAHRDIGGSTVVAVKATPRPDVFVLLRDIGSGRYDLTMGDRRLTAWGAGMDHSLEERVEARADHVVSALGGIKMWDYDGVRVGPELTFPSHTIALRGGKTLTASGLASLNPEDWARRLCSAVGNRDLGDDIPGVQTTGLCPR